MKVIILAGGLGTRISEETSDKPKPMVLIDDKPILWHLMNTFAVQGYADFVIALGYRGDVIKRWLLDLSDLEGDISVDVSNKSVTRLTSQSSTNWKVAALETGLNTQTGGRIAKCMAKYQGQRIIATYGDGLANIPISRLLEFHTSHGRLATVSSVRPPARFGQIQSAGGLVTHFGEKNQADAGWINGGYFILEPQVIQYILNDSEPFETGAIPRLVAEEELMTYQHEGFWQPMDTLREKQELARFAELIPPPWLNFD